ncbi:hypothetical protein [Campylobacter fetus]|uniref:putative barnase/colicin E5 family endoribonuclease n=1 Tax=Campylobacter fetus TaxID=196 RepID=UPI00040F7C65|nr:hypothetical protein [Campylobacter fetus]EAI4322652.1 hypothetical protein [Campylobacter fetus]EAI4391987.1 hypothetical protein [Campylobacter fetus]UEA64788.1 hypothetical protein LK457_06960 [Campylobacter fetus subsp. testudinum]
MDIEKELSNELNLPQMQIRASLQYLWDNHANDGMFKNKRDIYNTIKMLIGYQDYAGNSFKNPNMAYIATKTNDKRMSDMVISRDSAGVTHLNKDKKMSETDKNIFDSKSVVETPKSQRKQQVLGVQMNTSKEHYSPTNNRIIPQNSKQVKPTSEAGDDMIAITKLKNEIDELKATKQGGKYLSSQVKAEVIDKSNELGKLIDERISQGKSINQTLVSEYKAQIQRARYQASKEAKPTSAPVKTEVKTEPTTNKYLSGIKELEKVDYDSLNAHQKDIYDVFAGKKSSTILKVSDIDDLATLEQGSRNAGARKIMIKHAGVEKTGGLNGDELVDIEQTLLKGKIDNNSFETGDDFIRYSYAYNKNGTTLQVVINEFNNGKKIFDYYSDRNFIDYNKKPQVSGNTLTKNGATNGIIPQNIDNINPASEAQNFFKTLSEYNNLRDNIAKNNKKIDNEHFTLSKSIHNEINGNLSKIFNLVKERDIAAKSRLKKLETMFKFKGVTGNEALKDYLDDLTLIHFNSFSKEELDFIKLTKDKIIKSQGDILAGANKARSFRYGNLDTADDLKNKVFKLFSDLNIKANNFFELEPLLLSHSAKENELRHIVSLDTVSNARLAMEKEANITPIKEFGTNYAEFYHDGSNAIKKLLIEKQGQVAGAFEKEGLGDIDLVWGIEGTSHSDGYGLSKIAKYHPEAVDNLDNIISKGEFYKDEKGRLNIKYNDDIVGLRENWLGNETVPWIISSYTKKAETSKGFNSASSITPSKENYSFTTQHNNIIPQNTKFDNTPTFLNKYPKLIDDLKWDKTLKFSSAPKSKEELKARQAFLNEFKILSSKEKIDIKI